MARACAQLSICPRTQEAALFTVRQGGAKKVPYMLGQNAEDLTQSAGSLWTTGTFSCQGKQRVSCGGPTKHCWEALRDHTQYSCLPEAGLETPCC